MNYTQAHLEAFHRALEIIKDDIQLVCYNMWFKDLKLNSVYEDTIVLQAPTFFIISSLKNRYEEAMRGAFSLAFGKPYDIEIYTAEELERRSSSHAETMLNPKYTFDNFVVGPSNSFAYAASLAVAEGPNDAYNPLFIYGGVGLGKTHLMNAIGNFIIAQNPEAKVLFITSETFTNELIDSIVRKKGTSELRNKMRNVDVLLVDDIQFLSKTVATQEEFFHTFNHLHSLSKQIIISSDRPPKEIPTIEERLRSRFESGLIVDVQKPDYETRVAILRKKADEEEIDTPNEVLEFIAEKFESNIRELEGSLNRVKAQADLMGKPISLQTAQEALSQLFATRAARRVTSESIIQLVSNHYSLTEDELVSKKRSREIALPRQIAMYMIREMTQMSTTAIGRSFGGRDHTTVMHACEKIADQMKLDISFRKTVEELMEFARRK